MFYWNTKKKQKTNKTKVDVGVHISLEKKTGYIIPTMNCYLRNG